MFSRKTGGLSSKREIIEDYASVSVPAKSFTLYEASRIESDYERRFIQVLHDLYQ